MGNCDYQRHLHTSNLQEYMNFWIFGFLDLLPTNDELDDDDDFDFDVAGPTEAIFFA